MYVKNISYWHNSELFHYHHHHHHHTTFSSQDPRISTVCYPALRTTTNTDEDVTDCKEIATQPTFLKRLATIIHSNQMWGSLHDDSGIIVLHSHHNTTKIKSFHLFSLMDTYFQPTFHVHPEWQTRSHNRYLPSVDGEFALVRTLCFVIPYQAPFLPNECKCLQKVCDIKQNHMINKTNRFGENIVVVCAIMVIKAPTSHILDMAKPSWLICMQL